MNQPLATLASPDPRLIKAQLRHTQSEFGTFAAQRCAKEDLLFGFPYPSNRYRK